MDQATGDEGHVLVDCSALMECWEVMARLQDVLNSMNDVLPPPPSVLLSAEFSAFDGCWQQKASKKGQGSALCEPIHLCVCSYNVMLMTKRRYLIQSALLTAEAVIRDSFLTRLS